MYTLTLTHEERKAIDWIGNRYSNGDDLYRMIWGRSEQSPNDVDWDSPCDITFKIPENIAWNIRDNAKSEDGYWPCFAKELADKMQTFIDNIV